MSDLLKEQQLRRHKARATALFLLMAVIYVVTAIIQDESSPAYLGYIRAFSEAAMVGALADWYAVTAIFHHPLGLKIPHTNIIRKKKQYIGHNLGQFIVDKLLNPESVRPYIEKLKVSHYLARYLEDERTRAKLVEEFSQILLNTIQELDDREAALFIKRQSRSLAEHIDAHHLAAHAIDLVLDKRWHQALIVGLSQEIRRYITHNHKDIYKLVQEKSHALIPEHVDRKIAKEITVSLILFLLEIEANPDHPIYKTIPERLAALKETILEDQTWQDNLAALKQEALQDQQLERFAYEIWYAIKNTTRSHLMAQDTPFQQQLQRALERLSQSLQKESLEQARLDQWVQKISYRYFLRHRYQIAHFVSSTVESWDADQLNHSLELAVGKELQYIRINGTIIGGLVGVVIHSIHSFFL